MSATKEDKPIMDATETDKADVAIELHTLSKMQARNVSDESLYRYAESGQPCTNERGEPLIQFDEDVEARLRHKMDRHILPVIAVMYFVCFLDRSNVGNARIAGLEKDLGMSPTSFDFNFLVMSFYIAYALAEVPLTLTSKKLGPARVLPFCVCAFGILTICFSFVRNLREAIAVRVLLGVFEAPMLPGLAYYLGRFYRRAEMPIRVAVYIAAGPLASAVGSLLCSAILKIHSIGSLQRWEMIFLIEGLLTVVCGILGFLLLPSRLETASFLSPRERAVGIIRLKSERVASIGVIDSMRLKMTLQGMFSVTPVLVGLSLAVISFSAQSIGYMLPSIIKTLYPGRSTPEQQALSAPPYFVAMAVEVSVSFWVTKSRKYYFGMVPVILVGFVGFLMATITNVQHPSIRYAAILFSTIYSFALAPCGVSWVTVNCSSDTERAGALSLLMLIGNTANIASAWLYLPYDAPNYRRANLANTFLVCFSFSCLTMLYLYVRRENGRRERGERDQRFKELTFAQQEVLGHKHPRFRYL